MFFSYPIFIFCDIIIYLVLRIAIKHYLNHRLVGNIYFLLLLCLWRFLGITFEQSNYCSKHNGNCSYHCDFNLYIILIHFLSFFASNETINDVSTEWEKYSFMNS